MNKIVNDLNLTVEQVINKLIEKNYQCVKIFTIGKIHLAFNLSLIEKPRILGNK